MVIDDRDFRFVTIQQHNFICATGFQFINCLLYSTRDDSFGTEHYGARPEG